MLGTVTWPYIPLIWCPSHPEVVDTNAFHQVTILVVTPPSFGGTSHTHIDTNTTSLLPFLWNSILSKHFRKN